MIITDSIRKASDHSADFMVKVYGFRDQVLEGSVEHYCSGDTISFRGLMSLFDAVQHKLDEYAYPQASMAMRQWDIAGSAGGQREAFSPSDRQEEKTAFKALASFALHIQFRQNASWQGSLAWMEARRSVAFRSVLEMAFLIEQAVCFAAGQSPVQPREYSWKQKESVS